MSRRRPPRDSRRTSPGSCAGVSSSPRPEQSRDERARAPFASTCLGGSSTRFYPWLMDEEWPIAELFDEDYLHVYAPRLADEISDAEAATVWELLGLSERSHLLDLACGHGRIANRLAQRGARVTGLDATPMFLDRARQGALERGVSVEYIHGDMRELPWSGEFDAVLSWFTAYGYFDDRQNREV